MLMILESSQDWHVEQATLTTTRLRLVPLADEHLEHEAELDSDPEVMRYVALGPSSREDTEQAHRVRLEQARRMPGMGMWVGFTGEQFVGWWLLRPRSHSPRGSGLPERGQPGRLGPARQAGDSDIELGYRLLRRFWRQGLAKEGSRELVRHAFDELAASRVYAETMVVNEASRATMIAIGLQYVRAFHPDRDPSRLGAEFGDVEYAVTREQWLTECS